MKFDKIVMQSSPFLRCIQTASQIAQELQIVTEIEIDYLYCEHLTKSNFPEGNPINNLVYEVSKSDMNNFKQKYQIYDEIEFIDYGKNKKEALKMYPESDEQV